jgi:hypothetical protein
LAQKYYLVSDLHMGGDGRLQHCDYATEFIAFLKGLEKEDPETELLIVGDTFGFWELTLVHGTEKLEHIVKAHQDIFDQLKVTGARIKVTMMVGNHDYDLACDPAYGHKLRSYNIHLDTSLALIRNVGDKKIWIEHGQQRDQFNAFRDYGNPDALPVGYFITETFVSGASRHSDFGRGESILCPDGPRSLPNTGTRGCPRNPSRRHRSAPACRSRASRAGRSARPRRRPRRPHEREHACFATSAWSGCQRDKGGRFSVMSPVGICFVVVYPTGTKQAVLTPKGRARQAHRGRGAGPDCDHCASGGRGYHRCG